MARGCVGDALQELDELIGLASVKAEIGRLVAQLVNEQSYRARGASLLPPRRHLIFSGPSGVGKSRVARGFGEICERLGALRKGHIVSVDKADLEDAHAGRKIGAMRSKCEAALDGILFVNNNAFLPAGILRSTGDLRLDPVDVIVDFMLRHRGRFIVVLDVRPKQCGYISFHSGFARCFTETIHFAPYSAFELMQILAAQAKRVGLPLPEGLEADLIPWIMANRARADWRNAREMADLFGKVLGARTRRGARQHCEAFGTLERSDFKEALAALQVAALPNALISPAAQIAALPNGVRAPAHLAHPARPLFEAAARFAFPALVTSAGRSVGDSEP